MSLVRRHLLWMCLPTALLMFTLSVLVPAAAVAAETVKVQFGTPVELVFDQAVTGQTASPGQELNLRVASAVVVNGKTVVAAGAAAVAEVTVAKKAGMVGSAGLVTVNAKRVVAVDGTMIPLSGFSSLEGKSNVGTSVIVTILCCILGLLIKGQKAEIAPGSGLRATVATNVEVVVQ